MFSLVPQLMLPWIPPWHRGFTRIAFPGLSLSPIPFPLLSWSPYAMLNAHSVSVGMVKVLPKLKRLGWLTHTNCNTKWSLPLNAVVSPLVWCFAAPCGHFELVTVKDNTFFECKIWGLILLSLGQQLAIIERRKGEKMFSASIPAKVHFLKLLP